MPLAWGRDGSILRGFPSRMQVAERTIGYRRYGVTGRHIVDTWILAQLYDVGARDLESYGLKDVARHFGIAAPDRTYLPPEEIPRIFRDDPGAPHGLRARRRHRDPRRSPRSCRRPTSCRPRALPFDYQTTVLRGNATKIDALLMREYLHRRQAVPAPRARSRRGGRLHRHVPARGGPRRAPRGRDLALSVADADPGPRSRPPTAWESPPRCSRDLREFRVSAKRLAREAAAPEDRIFLNALQQTFKIFINSFYGYLAFSQGHWNDFDVANQVTGRGPAARAGPRSSGSTPSAPP